MILINIDMFGNLKPIVNMDTHTAFKRLVRAGLQEKVAESVVEILDENQKFQFDKLVTKEHIDSVIFVNTTELKREIAEVRAELRKEIAEVRTDLREFKVEVAGNFYLLKWMFGISISLSLAIIGKLFLV